MKEIISDGPFGETVAVFYFKDVKGLNRKGAVEFVGRSVVAKLPEGTLRMATESEVIKEYSSRAMGIPQYRVMDGGAR